MTTHFWYCEFPDNNKIILIPVLPVAHLSAFWFTHITQRSVCINYVELAMMSFRMRKFIVQVCEGNFSSMSYPIRHWNRLQQ